MRGFLINYAQGFLTGILIFLFCTLMLSYVGTAEGMAIVLGAVMILAFLIIRALVDRLQKKGKTNDKD